MKIQNKKEGFWFKKQIQQHSNQSDDAEIQQQHLRDQFFQQKQRPPQDAPELSSAKLESRIVHFTFLEILRKLEFYVFFFAFGWVVGCGQMVFMNIGEMLQSLAGPDSSPDIQDDYIIILSICNCVGRLMFGIASDYLSNRITRPVFFVISAAMLCGGMFYFYFISDLTLLYGGTVLIGIAYSGIWSMCPIMCQELWGSDHFPVNWNVFNIASSLTNFGLSAMLANLYDANITDGGNKCYGSGCYGLSFLIMGIICGVNVFFRYRFDYFV